MVMAPATSYASQEKIEFEIHYFFDGVAAIMASAMAQLWTSSKYSFKLWAILSSHRYSLPQKQPFATAQYRDLHSIHRAIDKRFPRTVQDVCLGSPCIVLLQSQR